ncbi:MAG: MBL fold metallo-hydrolase [Terriglobia bacterium]
MRIRFWGVRGSTPTPEPRNSRYGGNTCCIEVRLADNTVIILDCGSGMRGLGKSLQDEFGERPIHASLYLTHFHWDHIQGIPFFLPFYRRGNQFMFHSVMRTGAGLKDTIEGQMANPYFPVNMGVMGAQRDFSNLDNLPASLKGATLRSTPLNHPQGCMGYRIEADGGVFVLATDNEPRSPVHDQGLRDLARDADVMVYDAQYTPEQLAGEKKGWGHSSWLEGVRISQECNVKKLILFHHDPDSDDAFVDGLVMRAQQEFPDTWGANEGLTISLPDGVMSHTNQIGGSERRIDRRYHVELPLRVMWRDADGNPCEAAGVAKDISRTGIFFVVPNVLRADEPVQLELVLPDEITHQGELRINLQARPVRQEHVANSLREPAPGVAVAASLDNTGGEPPIPPPSRRR